MNPIPRKLMVRVTNWVGDAIMSLPALQHLRKALPETEIVLVARPPVADLYNALENAGAVGNRIIVCDPKNGRGGLIACRPTGARQVAEAQAYRADREGE